MGKASAFEKERRSVAQAATAFLMQNFGCSPRSIRVLMDQEMVVIRVHKFLSPAEIGMGLEKGDTRLLHEMYAQLFEGVKAPLVARIEHATRKEVMSSQIHISLECESCVMNFFLSPRPEKEGPCPAAGAGSGGPQAPNPGSEVKRFPKKLLRRIFR
jgi:uncharacterized protein YbcI